MRVAVISDIHGNAHALAAVLEAIEAEAPNELWCLGDTVGYGPKPNECCALVAARTQRCLAGNHDLLALGKEVMHDDFNPDAAVSGLWTRTVMDASSRQFLGGLEPQDRADGVELFHASARDPVWEYVLSGEAAAATFELTATPLVLVGHSHVRLAISLADGQLTGGHAPAGTEQDLRGRRWLCNPGSVGQPRDGDPRAAWLLLDLDAGLASFRRTAYAIDATQAEIGDAGLPEPLATRLEHGL